METAKVILVRTNYFFNRQAQPLGLAYLGACLKKAGWSVRLIDAAPLNYQEKDILKEIRLFKPIAVCLTATTPELSLAVRLAKKIKRQTNLPIIIGGPHASTAPSQTLNTNCFDFVVIGEGEITLPLLLRAIRKRKSWQKLRGLAFKKGHQVIINSPRPLIKNLDCLPFPARHLLPEFQKYAPLPSSYKQFPVATMITARGCPFHCAFCEHSVFGYQTRLRHPRSVVKEMELLAKQYGVKEICFWDDTFNLDQQRAIEICRLIVRKKLRLSWSCQARVNFISPSLLIWMKRAGCWRVSYGIESGSEKILKLINKRTTLKMIERAVKATKAAGLEAKGFFMLGLPGETAADIEMTLKFSQELPLDYAVFSIATPFLGTKLYSQLTPQQKKKLGNFKQLITTQHQQVYFTQKISGKKVIAYQKQAYRQFYFRPSYWLRQLASLQTPADLFLKIRSLSVLRGNV